MACSRIIQRGDTLLGASAEIVVRNLSTRILVSHYVEHCARPWMGRVGESSWPDGLLCADAPPPSTLGLDLGNSASKQAYCYTDNNGDRVLHRVPFVGDHDHPLSPRQPLSQFEIISKAGVDRNGQLVTGRAAIALDDNWTLKTAAVFRALRGGSVRSSKKHPVLRIIEGLPGGPDILRAVEEATVTYSILDRTLREHVGFLRTLALAHAAQHGANITKISVTYPGYLCPHEHGPYFDAYLGVLEDIIASVWGQEIELDFVSEGQACAQYIVDHFRDSVSGTKSYITELVRDLNRQSGSANLDVVLLVVDIGSSTLVGRPLPAFILRSSLTACPRTCLFRRCILMKT